MRNHPKQIWRIYTVCDSIWFEMGLYATEIAQGDLFSYSLTNSDMFKTILCNVRKLH
jgi:hypothetical protein